MPTNYPFQQYSLSDAMAGGWAQGRAMRKEFMDDQMRRKAGAAFAGGDLPKAAGIAARGGDLGTASQLQELQMLQQKTAQEKQAKDRQEIASAANFILSTDDPAVKEKMYPALRADAALNKGYDVSRFPAQWGPEAENALRMVVARNADMEKAMDRQAKMDKARFLEKGRDRRTRAQIESRENIAAANIGDRQARQARKFAEEAEEYDQVNVRLPGGEEMVSGVENKKTGRILIPNEAGDMVPAPRGATVHTGTVTATEAGQTEDEVAVRNYRRALDSARGATQLGTEIVKELDRGDVRLGVAGALANTVNNLRADIQQMASLVAHEKDERSLNEYLETEDFDEVFQKHAIAGQRVKSALTLLAYMQAKAYDRSGRISDKDFDKHLESLAGKYNSDPDKLRDTIIRAVNRIQDRIAKRAGDMGFDVPTFEWQYADYGQEQPGGGAAEPGGETRGAQTYTGPNGRTVTPDEIEATARKHGIPPEEVIRKLRLSPADRR